MGIRTDLLVTEEIAESSDLRANPFEFERAQRVEAALSILEGKWKIAILNRLFARPIWRFSELERAVPGISQRMLSQQLRLLEKCELVKRTVHPQFPPKVEYELTEFGKTLCPAMKTLVDWAMTFPKTRETSRYQQREARKAFECFELVIRGKCRGELGPCRAAGERRLAAGLGMACIGVDVPRVKGRDRDIAPCRPGQSPTPDTVCHPG
jgi:DNA-binding HxlR family transcriptional regulator